MTGDRSWPRVVLLCALVALLDGYDAQAIAYVGTAVAIEMRLPLGALGPVFAAALVGLALGSLVFGAVADRVGRRWIIVAACAVFGAASLAAADAHDPQSLMLWRFVTGIGLGAALPNVVALTAEHAPPGRGPVLVAIVAAGLPGGAVLAGLVGIAVVPSFGWRSMLLVGGVLPLVLAGALAVWLAESVAFAVSRRGVVPPRRGVNLLFADGRAAVTLLLWATLFLNLLLMFFVFSWLPSLMARAGLSQGASALSGMVFNAGGVAGGFAQGRLAARFGPWRTLIVSLLAAAASVACIGVAADRAALLIGILLLGGAFAVGAQIGTVALASQLYPTALRATGVGAALTIGRLGSIVGPLVGGLMIDNQWTIQAIFAAASVPGLAGAGSVALLAAMGGRRALRAATRAEA